MKTSRRSSPGPSETSWQSEPMELPRGEPALVGSPVSTTTGEARSRHRPTKASRSPVQPDGGSLAAKNVVVGRNRVEARIALPSSRLVTMCWGPVQVLLVAQAVDVPELGVGEGAQSPHAGARVPEAQHPQLARAGPIGVWRAGRSRAPRSRSRRARSGCACSRGRDGTRTRRGGPGPAATSRSRSARSPGRGGRCSVRAGRPDRVCTGSGLRAVRVGLGRTRSHPRCSR